MWQGDTGVFISRYTMIRWMEDSGIEISGLALATSVGQAGPPCGVSGDSGVGFWGSCWKRLFMAQWWAY